MTVLGFYRDEKAKALVEYHNHRAGQEKVLEIWIGSLVFVPVHASPDLHQVQNMLGKVCETLLASSSWVLLGC